MPVCLTPWGRVFWLLAVVRGLEVLLVDLGGVLLWLSEGNWSVVSPLAVSQTEQPGTFVHRVVFGLHRPLCTARDALEHCGDPRAPLSPRRRVAGRSAGLLTPGVLCFPLLCLPPRSSRFFKLPFQAPSPGPT